MPMECCHIINSMYCIYYVVLEFIYSPQQIVLSTGIVICVYLLVEKPTTTILLPILQFWNWQMIGRRGRKIHSKIIFTPGSAVGKDNIARSMSASTSVITDIKNYLLAESHGDVLTLDQQIGTIKSRKVMAMYWHLSRVITLWCVLETQSYYGTGGQGTCLPVEKKIHLTPWALLVPSTALRFATKRISTAMCTILISPNPSWSLFNIWPWKLILGFCTANLSW